MGKIRSDPKFKPARNQNGPKIETGQKSEMGKIGTGPKSKLAQNRNWPKN